MPKTQRYAVGRPGRDEYGNSVGCHGCGARIWFNELEWKLYFWTPHFDQTPEPPMICPGCAQDIETHGHVKGAIHA